MFEILDYDKNNLKTVCETNGKHSNMLMDIKVKKFHAGESYTVFSDDKESAFLLLYGDCDISWDCETENMHRESPFVKAAFCLHIPKGIEVKIKANKETEILIQQT